MKNITLHSRVILCLTHQYALRHRSEEPHSDYIAPKKIQ